MLYIRGIAIKQRYAGAASVTSLKSILTIADTIRNPTKINAGAVANPGIAVKIGANKIAIRNMNPVTTDAKPVLAPAPTPAELSTKVVVDVYKRQAYDYYDTNKYWNLHTSGRFVKEVAKTHVIEMAVHDEIFYRQAMAEKLTLDEKEEEQLRSRQEDFLSLIHI